MEPSTSGVTVEAAAQPDQSANQSSQEQLVPVSALQAERRERQQLQDTVKMMQDHMQLLQSKAVPMQQNNNELNGLSDNDVLTIGEAKKFMNDFTRKQELAVEELKMTQVHPDYHEVVTKYLPDAIKNDRDLKDMIMSASNPYKAAYFIAKKSDSYMMDQRTQNRSPEAKQVHQNISRAGNLSQTGSVSASVPQTDYKRLSDNDFKALAARNRG